MSEQAACVIMHTALISQVPMARRMHLNRPCRTLLCMGGTLYRRLLRLPTSCWCVISLETYISSAAASHLWL